MCFIATDWHKAELEQTNLSRTQLIQKAMTDGKVSKLSSNCTSEPYYRGYIKPYLTAKNVYLSLQRYLEPIE